MARSSDDLPAHVKASILGLGLMVAITHGKLNMGLWLGIYLCEHRDHADGRHLVLTMMGSPAT
jgi:thiamine phosphate synthase YjbQ (UPF0047 family)